ncbi:hypothetical protein SULYE_0301 [Sulfurihydrogenibium yellowstonense SS-5]|uniref:Uncharacterized protein n=1 Tax=Sulfurihydrogenibium yellowstonense SS-5 TaxID=432331 RepID=C4FIB7_9AQUI|nr:hypothetical protein SULYE_0301 [Sulfurihydrogenibium yellowstonense SS-5]
MTYTNCHIKSFGVFLPRYVLSKSESKLTMVKPNFSATTY